MIIEMDLIWLYKGHVGLRVPHVVDWCETAPFNLCAAALAETPSLFANRVGSDQLIGSTFCLDKKDKSNLINCVFYQSNIVH